MAKTLQFRDGSEDGPTGKFLLAVTHEAHRRLAPDQAEGVVAEVRDHIGAQVEMQVMNGMARSLAEREAVQGFGSARQFVRGVSHSLHDTRKAEIARTATLALTSVTLAGMFFFNCRFGPSEWAGRHMPYYLLPIIGLAVMVGSWIGWRAQPRQHALLGASFVLAVTLWFGFDTVTLPAKPEAKAPWLPTYSRNYSRSYMRRAEEAATIRRDMAAADVKKLTEGISAFQMPIYAVDVQKTRKRFFLRQTLLDTMQQVRLRELSRNPRQALPVRIQEQARLADIHTQIARLDAIAANAYNRSVAAAIGSERMKPFITKQHFQAPRTFIPYHAQESAFGSISFDRMSRGSFESAADHARSYQQAVQQAPPILQSFQQAQVRWNVDGQRWLWARKEELANQERALDTIRRVEAAPFGFNIRAALATLTQFPIWVSPLLLVLLNVIPAFLARQTRRMWDGWVWRIRSTA